VFQSGFGYPKIPMPNAAVQRMENATRMIIVKSSDFMCMSPLQVWMDGSCPLSSRGGGRPVASPIRVACVPNAAFGCGASFCNQYNALFKMGDIDG
jgi:hypothetical protein